MLYIRLGVYRKKYLTCAWSISFFSFLGILIDRLHLCPNKKFSVGNAKVPVF